MTIKILIVDDEPINIELIEEILECEDDFQYKSASNGFDALALLDYYNPDIIILDIMMPGISGYDVCRRIKKDKKHKFAKVVMVSGKARIEERLEGYEAGADDYITKPFVVDELLAKLKVFSKLKKTEEIDELKTTTLQLFSHETQTPLNGILLGSQLILESDSVSDEIAEYARLIHLSGERISDLVRKILLLSNLRSNITLHFSHLSVAHFLHDIADFSNSNRDNKSKLTVNCPMDFSLKLDWKLFRQAFMFVVENGLKYSPDGEVVELSAVSSDQGVIVRVADHGAGIAPENTDQIFDEFFSQNIEHHTKGTALSLAITKEIINLHRGTIHVESTSGQGSTFIFTFPFSALTPK